MQDILHCFLMNSATTCLHSKSQVLIADIIESDIDQLLQLGIWQLN